MMHEELKKYKTKRLELGLTLESVCKVIDISISNLSKIERGLITLSPETANKLNEFYGLDVKPIRVKTTIYEDYFDVPAQKLYILKQNEELKLINKELKIENRELRSNIKELQKRLAKIDKALGGDIDD